MIYRFLSSLLLMLTMTPVTARTNTVQNGFVRNAGQVRDQYGNARTDIDFRIRGKGSPSVFLSNKGLYYQWYHRPSGEGWDSIRYHRLEMQLSGSNSSSRPSAGRTAVYRERYFQSWSAAAGTVASSYGDVIYTDVYPGIDWRLYFTPSGKLEYDFIIHADGDISNIKMIYGGHSSIRRAPDGGMEIVTPAGIVTEKAPKAYLADDGSVVSVSFELHGDTVSFNAPSHGGTLIIDPVLEWSSYFGDADLDLSYAVASGPAGSLYLAGATSSLANIATTGAYQGSFGGGAGYFGNDAFLARFTADGECLWATYYGGSEEDIGTSVASDNAGNIYLAGYTAGSTGLATPGSHQPLPGGGYDGFLVRFDSSGNRLWATYYGGSADDCWGGPVPVSCDQAGNVYLAGTTQSTGLATPGAAQATPGGYDDAFLVKFDVSGNRYWATYLGGEANDYMGGICTDTGGNVIATGTTNSTTGIAAPGAYLGSLAGDSDGFLARYSDTGTLLWATYFGGSAAEYGKAVSCDTTGAIYMAGITSSSGGIATPGAWQDTFAGGYEDVYLARFTPSGIPDWSTYYGGNDLDEALSVKATAAGTVYLAGMTASTAALDLPGALQPLYGGGTDALLSKFNNTGELVWSTYYGGADWDQLLCIDADSAGDILAAGFTTSATGIATVGSYQQVYAGGDGDGFFLRIRDCDLPTAAGPIQGPVEICAGVETEYYFAATGNAVWILPPGWSGNSNSDTISVTADGTGGNIHAVAINSCGASDTLSLAVSVWPAPSSPVITRYGNMLSVPATYDTYAWSLDGVEIPGANMPSVEVTASGDYHVRVTGDHGCLAYSDTVSVELSGISELLTSRGISVFPNPAIDGLSIRTPASLKIVLMDFTGRVLLKRNVPAGTTRVPLGRLSSGSYILGLYEPDNIPLGTIKFTKAP